MCCAMYPYPSRQGETLGLVGESGCGKSTLGQAMMGFLRSGSQTVGAVSIFQDLDMFNLTSRQLENIRGNQIALIPQNAGESLTPTLRVGNQIVEAIELHTELSGRRGQRADDSAFGPGALAPTGGDGKTLPA